MEKIKCVSMPSQAYTSFLQKLNCRKRQKPPSCQCPLGLIPHFYEGYQWHNFDTAPLCQCPLGLIPHFYTLNGRSFLKQEWVSMPSRAYTSFLLATKLYFNHYWAACQCPLGLIPHFYMELAVLRNIEHDDCVNALSGLYLISTKETIEALGVPFKECQCPLGLIPHFYPGKEDLCPSLILVSVNALSGLYLISTKAEKGELMRKLDYCVNALSGLYLISTVPLQKPRFYAVFRACFCRYLSEYSDNSRFSCMLTFWTYLIRCTYP